jgi:hypothetical protein
LRVLVSLERIANPDTAVLTNAPVKDKQGTVRATTAAAHVLEAARASGWNVVHAPLDLSNDPNYLIFRQK